MSNLTVAQKHENSVIQSLMKSKSRGPVNLHLVRRQLNLPPVFSTPGKPVEGVDYIPPPNLGLRNNAPKRMSFTASAYTKELPDYFCWTDPQCVKEIHGETKRAIKPYVYEQGYCGCCWAIATTTMLQDRLTINNPHIEIPQLSFPWMGSCDSKGTCPSSQIQSSELDATSNGDVGDCGCDGGYLDVSAKFTIDEGVVCESCYKFNYRILKEDEPKFPNCPNPKKCSDGSEPKFYKGIEYGTISDALEMQKEIIQNGPMTTGFVVYNEFYITPSGTSSMGYTGDWQNNGIYIFGGKGNVEGGHAVVIVGWGTDPTNGIKYWIVRNSWSDNWNSSNWIDTKSGKKFLPGFFKIAITGLNKGRPNDKIYMDSVVVDGFAGSVWITPQPQSSEAFKLMDPSPVVSSPVMASPEIIVVQDFPGFPPHMSGPGCCRRCGRCDGSGPNSCDMYRRDSIKDRMYYRRHRRMINTLIFVFSILILLILISVLYTSSKSGGK